MPDFLDSLLEFRPDLQRVDGREHLVLFPMYTQNGNPNRNLEALLVKVMWPSWLADVEQGGYDNPMFVPITFVDFTEGYDTHSAVLFPETVAVREVPRFSWGGIFCDREAARFRTVSTAAAETLRLAVPPDAARLLGNQDLAQSTFALWDLVHDRTHSHGDLPFDPFMIKQRMPFWMYALEELRCDLNAFRSAIALEAEGEPHARLVRFAIVFDRLFRFPITGNRVRNYDGLGGQLLFSYLHRSGVLHWTDNALSLDWVRAAGRGRRPVRRGREALPRRHRPLEDRPLDGGARVRLPLRTSASGVGLGPGHHRPAAPGGAAQDGRRGAAGRVPAQRLLRGAASASSSDVIESASGITA